MTITRLPTSSSPAQARDPSEAPAARGAELSPGPAGRLLRWKLPHARRAGGPRKTRAIASADVEPTRVVPVQELTQVLRKLVLAQSAFRGLEEERDPDPDDFGGLITILDEVIVQLWAWRDGDAEA